MEKLLPWKQVANYSVAVVLLVLGVAVAFAPSHVPGLTEPDSAAAMSAMDAMGNGDAMHDDAMPGDDGMPKNGGMPGDKGMHDDAMGGR
jgi:hypothetical protein